MIRVRKLKKHKIAIDFTCDKCGKPLINTNKHGMFCEDLCGEKEAKKAYRKLREIIKDLASGGQVNEGGQQCH